MRLMQSDTRDYLGASRICQFTFFTPLASPRCVGGKSFLFPPLNKGRVRVGFALYAKTGCSRLFRTDRCFSQLGQKQNSVLRLAVPTLQTYFQLNLERSPDWLMLLELRQLSVPPAIAFFQVSTKRFGCKLACTAIQIQGGSELVYSTRCF